MPISNKVGKSEAVEIRKDFDLVLPKALSAVEDGRLALLEHCRPLNFDAKVINRIEVILEELVSNIVRHASHATQIHLTASPCKEGLCLCIEDNGDEFNLLDADERGPFDRLDNAQLGGLGIPLIKRLSHSVEYARIGSANRVRVIVAA